MANRSSSESSLSLASAASFASLSAFAIFVSFAAAAANRSTASRSAVSSVAIVSCRARTSCLSFLTSRFDSSATAFRRSSSLNMDSSAASALMRRFSISAAASCASFSFAAADSSASRAFALNLPSSVTSFSASNRIVSASSLVRSSSSSLLASTTSRTHSTHLVNGTESSMRCHLAATFSTMRRVRLISRTLSRHDMNACDVDWFRHRYISFVIFAVLRSSASCFSRITDAALSRSSSAAASSNLDVASRTASFSADESFSAVCSRRPSSASRSAAAAFARSSSAADDSTSAAASLTACLSDDASFSAVLSWLARYRMLFSPASASTVRARSRSSFSASNVAIIFAASSPSIFARSNAASASAPRRFSSLNSDTSLSAWVLNSAASRLDVSAPTSVSSRRRRVRSSFAAATTSTQSLNGTES